MKIVTASEWEKREQVHLKHLVSKQKHSIGVNPPFPIRLISSSMDISRINNLKDPGKYVKYAWLNNNTSYMVTLEVLWSKRIWFVAENRKNSKSFLKLKTWNHLKSTYCSSLWNIISEKGRCLIGTLNNVTAQHIQLTCLDFWDMNDLKNPKGIHTVNFK